MNTMTSMVGVSLIFVAFLALVPIALLIVLQVWLCRKGKWLGMILPVLSLLMSLMMVLSLASFQTHSESVIVYGADGQIIQGQHHAAQEEVHHRALTPGAAGAVAGVFLVSNIPTVIFGGIWLYYKNRRDFQEDLNKMKIEDLE